MLAGFGGLIYNILPLMQLGKLPRDARPDFTDPLFWLPFAVWPILAAVLGYAYNESAANLTPLLALNVGLSAPLVFRAMSEANPFGSGAIDPGGEDA